jgi:hypothetical protein
MKIHPFFNLTSILPRSPPLESKVGITVLRRRLVSRLTAFLKLVYCSRFLCLKRYFAVESFTEVKRKPLRLISVIMWRILRRGRYEDGSQIEAPLSSRLFNTSLFSANMSRREGARSRCSSAREPRSWRSCEDRDWEGDAFISFYLGHIHHFLISSDL